MKNEITVEIMEEGTRVRDTITGVEGYVTAWCHYYGHDTDQVRVSYKSDTGTLIEDWIAISRLLPCELPTR